MKDRARSIYDAGAQQALLVFELDADIAWCSRCLYGSGHDRRVGQPIHLAESGDC